MNNVFSMWQVKIIFISLFFWGFLKGDSIDDPSPMMKLNKMQKLPSLLMSQPDIIKAGKILESNSEYSGNSLAQSSGLEMFEEAFGITSNITSFSQEAMGLPFFNMFNNVAGELGLLFSLKQFAFEIYEGKEEPAKLNLAKNLTLYSLGKWGTRSLKIANAGIFFIDYSLTKFGTKGLEVREKKYQEEYDILLPWQSPRRDKVFWTKFITDVVLSTKDFKASLDKEIDVYLKYPFTQKDFPMDLQEILIQKEKEKLLKILHEAVKDAKNQLEEKRKKEILEKFGKMKSMLNEKIGILVHVFEGNKGLSGVPVRIIVNKDPKLWAGKTDKAGQWWFNCTRLGYLHYGKPTVVEIQHKNKTYKKNLSIDNWGSGRVEFVLEGDEDDKDLIEVSIIEPLSPSTDLKEGRKDKKVFFTAQVNDTSAYRYIWNFGDGNTYESKPRLGENSIVANKYTNVNRNSSYKVTVDLCPLKSDNVLSTTSLTIYMNPPLSEDDKYNLIMASLPDYIKNFDIGWEPDYSVLKRRVRISENNRFSVEYSNSKTAYHGKYIRKDGNTIEVGGKYEMYDHGRISRFHINGTLLSDGVFKMGKKEGWHYGWNEQGQKTREAYYENGKIVEARSWHETGKLCSEINYKTGISNSWHMNGTKIEEYFFDEKGKQGKYQKWDSMGRIRAEGNYVNGKKINPWYWHTYSSNGTKNTRRETMIKDPK